MNHSLRNPRAPHSVHIQNRVLSLSPARLSCWLGSVALGALGREGSPEGRPHQLQIEPYSINQAALELLTTLLTQPLKTWEDWDLQQEYSSISPNSPRDFEKKIAFYFKCVYVPTHSARVLVLSFYHIGPSHPAWWLRSHLPGPLRESSLSSLLRHDHLPISILSLRNIL